MTESATEIVIVAPGGSRSPRRPARHPTGCTLRRSGSDESRRTMATCLSHIAQVIGNCKAAEFPWHQLRYEHTTVIRAAIVTEGKSPKSREQAPLRIARSAAGGVVAARHAASRGLPARNRHPRGEGSPRASRPEHPRRRDDGNARRVHSDRGPGRDPHAARIATLESTGMRRAEAAGALLERYDPGVSGPCGSSARATRNAPVTSTAMPRRRSSGGSSRSASANVAARSSGLSTSGGTSSQGR